jgi:hypothetical protein
VILGPGYTFDAQNRRMDGHVDTTLCALSPCTWRSKWETTSWTGHVRFVPFPQCSTAVVGL